MARKRTSETARAAGPDVELSHIAEALRPLAVPVADLLGPVRITFVRSQAAGTAGRSLYRAQVASTLLGAVTAVVGPTGRVTRV
jgi:hypothetical protein